jgi:putative SbcD/Mre11-related phosphoesterase
MDRSRLELEPGLWLDAARAVWLEGARVLAVADLHLGYAWAHRASGQLMPLSAEEDTAERLIKLIDRYRPEEVVILGDIVHRAIDAPALHTELRWLALTVGERARLRLIGGNHDRQLAALLAASGIALEVADMIAVGPHLLLHGDEPNEAVAEAHLRTHAAQGGRVIFGHEHPAFILSDGVASRIKCPCFLAGAEALILPAFSLWAAGTAFGGGALLSPYARRTCFDRAVAIVGEKLLPIRLSPGTFSSR